MSNLMVKLPYLMENIILENLLKSILIGDKMIKIDEKIFPIKGMIGQGYHKQVFEIDDEKNDKVIKIVRKDAKNIVSAFLSFKQAIENQKVLEELGLNYTKIVDFDKSGPPYRFLIQEKIPDDSVSVADLIKNKKLNENDIYQIAEIVNKLEKDKKLLLSLLLYSVPLLKCFILSLEYIQPSECITLFSSVFPFIRMGAETL